VKSEAGLAQRTPDLAPVVQEVVDAPAWQAGDGLALFVTGTGKRSVVAFDGGAGGATLHVEFATQTPVCAP